MRRTPWGVPLAVAFLATLAFGACSDLVGPEQLLPVGSIQVTGAPAGGLLLEDSTVTVDARVLAADTRQLPGRRVVWASSAQDVVAITLLERSGARATWTALRAGTATVSATVDGVTQEFAISVQAGMRVPPAGSGPVTAFLLDSAVRLTVSPGAAPAGTTLLVSPASSSVADDRYVAGTAFDFAPSPTTFGAPVTLSLRFDAAGVAVADRAELRVFRIVGGAAEELADGLVDAVTRRVSAPLQGFSRYAIFRRSTPTTLEIVSGSEQTATVDSSPASAIVVRAVDSRLRAVARVPIRFLIDSGGGQLLDTTTILTDRFGRATVPSGRWQMGPTVGVNTLRVSTTEGSVPAIRVRADALPKPRPTIALGRSSVEVVVPAGTIANPVLVPVTNSATNASVLRSLTATVAYATPPARNWLTASLVSTQAPTNIALSLLTDSLAAGTYDATVTIGSSERGYAQDVTVAVLPVRVIVTPGGVSALVVTTQPSAAVSGTTLAGEFVVEARDAFGNRVAVSPTLQVRRVSGSGTLVAFRQRSTVPGVVVVDSVRIDGAGTHALEFSVSGALPAISNSLQVTQRVASLALIVQPSASTDGQPFAQTPQIEVRDDAGLRVIGSNALVSASVVDTTGAVSGLLRVAATDGVASFTGLGIEGAGSHRLAFVTAGVAAVQSEPVVVTAVAGMALKIGLTPFVVAAADAVFVLPINLDLSQRGAQNLAAVAVTVSWDVSMLQLVSRDSGTWQDSEGGSAVSLTSESSLSTGQLRLAAYTLGATNASALLQTLRFRRTSAAIALSNLSVTVQVEAAGDSAGQSVTLRTRSVRIMLP